MLIKPVSEPSISNTSELSSAARVPAFSNTEPPDRHNEKEKGRSLSHSLIAEGVTVADPSLTRRTPPAKIAAPPMLNGPPAGTVTVPESFNVPSDIDRFGTEKSPDTLNVPNCRVFANRLYAE